jgi:hypothetical protein
VEDGGNGGVVFLGEYANESADFFEGECAIHSIIRAGENVQILACWYLIAPAIFEPAEGGILSTGMKGWGDYHSRRGGSLAGLGVVEGRSAWGWGIPKGRFCWVCWSGCSSTGWRSWCRVLIGFSNWCWSVRGWIRWWSFGSWGLIARSDSSSFDSVVLLLVFLSFWGRRCSFFFVLGTLFRDRRYRFTFARLSIIVMWAILGITKGRLRLRWLCVDWEGFIDLDSGLMLCLWPFCFACFLFSSGFDWVGAYISRFPFSVRWITIGLRLIPFKRSLSVHNSSAVILEEFLSIWSALLSIFWYS